MAPPATKRRKLSHEPSSSASEHGFGSDSNSDGVGTRHQEPSTELEDSSSDRGDWSGGQEEGNDGEENRTVDVGLAGFGRDHEETAATERTGTKQRGSQDRLKPTVSRNAHLNETMAYTGESYTSNIFKLQLDQLLACTKATQLYTNVTVEDTLRSIKNLIESIPDVAPCTFAEAEKALSRSSHTVIPYPDPRPPKDAKYKLEYRRPANINIVGSYATKTMTRLGDNTSIDIAVTMPAAILQEKDYLNYRYFYKRAFYIATIADALRREKPTRADVEFEFAGGNVLHPILVLSNVQGEGKEGTHLPCKVKIIPYYPAGALSADKLHPSRNCVRPMNTTGEPSAASTKLPATPFYNASVAADGATIHYLKLVHRVSNTADGFVDACVLGRIWLHGRGITTSSRGFGSFEWAALMALLLESPNELGASLSPTYSGYQLFKATLQFLASRDLSRHSFKSQATPHVSHKSSIADSGGSLGCPTFLDTVANLNILYRMTPWSYAALRDEAGATISALGTSAVLEQQIDTTFNRRTSANTIRFDSIVQLPINALQEVSAPTSQDGKDSSTYLPKIIHKLYRVLTRALGDRVSHLDIRVPPRHTWSPSSSAPSHTFASADSTNHLAVGLVFNANNVTRTLDRGPSAEAAGEAAAFRSFWGSKSELRRFKDGSIVETLDWTVSSGDDQNNSGHTIHQRIIHHIVSLHFSPTLASALVFRNDFLSRQLPEIPSSAEMSYNYPGTATFKSALSAFQKLERDLRALDGLPLQFRHILAADEQLSYTSLHSPSSSSRRQSQPISVVVEFEGSSRWPDALPAIQKTKGAFLLKIAECIEEAHGNAGIIARVGLENSSAPLQNQVILDVTTPAGVVAGGASTITFRLRIRLEREQLLLERALNSKAFGLEARAKEAHANALSAYKRNMLRLPAHSQALTTLCTRLPALSPSIRLLKKWFASHLLSPHVPAQVIELLVIRSFVTPAPWQIPSSAITGFLRSLWFVAHWDWRTEPLSVDFAGDMSAETRAGINTRFEAWRKIDPAMNRVVLFAASSVDTDGTTWTDRARPAKVVASRMTALARAAMKAVEAPDAVEKLDPKTLFVSSMTDYDFILHLSPKFRKSRASTAGTDTQFRNLALQGGVSMKEVAQIGYDPLNLFYEELQRVYGHVAVYFFDTGAGKAIAGLWNPASTATRSWKVRIPYSTIPLVKGGDEEQIDAALNKEGLLAQMARLGGDLIERVEVVKA